MKRNVLELTQAILNDMDADEVTAITDTFESEQVAVIVRDAYFALIDSRNWPHLKQFITIPDAVFTAPTWLTLPDSVKELIRLQYDVAKLGETRKRYRELKYLFPDEFLDKTNQRNNDNANIIISADPAGSNAQILIRNDIAPTWWTSFDDQIIVMDAFDTAVSVFLESSKVQAYVYVTPVWVHSDTHVPDLPEEAFTLLLEEAKSTAFLTLKQMVNEKAESRSQKADAWLSRKAFVTRGGVRYFNYGRNKNNIKRYKPQPLDKDN